MCMHVPHGVCTTMYMHRRCCELDLNRCWLRCYVGYLVYICRNDVWVIACTNFRILATVRSAVHGMMGISLDRTTFTAGFAKKNTSREAAPPHTLMIVCCLSASTLGRCSKHAHESFSCFWNRSSFVSLEHSDAFRPASSSTALSITNTHGRWWRGQVRPRDLWNPTCECDRGTQTS